MKRLLNFINDLDLDERTQHLIDGVLDNNALPIKVKEFSTMPVNEQQLYMVKLAERVKQITKPYKLLTVMLLIEQLIKANPHIELPKLEYPNLKLNNSKEHLILSNMAKYYQYFLNMNSCSKYNLQTLNVEEQLEEAEQYCRIAVLKILQFLKIDFIFVYAWTKVPKHRHLLRLIGTSILDRFRQDLKILTTFINNNLMLVLQKTVKHPLAFHINHIYQKVIIINKEMKKIEQISKLYQINPEYPKYQVDLELNRAVELEMLERKEEKKEFYKNPQQNNKYERNIEEVDIMSTESFILLNDEEEEEQ